jgi:hypothetical protein
VAVTSPSATSQAGIVAIKRNKKDQLTDDDIEHKRYDWSR